jgi:hypothetical protein
MREPLFILPAYLPAWVHGNKTDRGLVVRALATRQRLSVPARCTPFTSSLSTSYGSLVESAAAARPRFQPRSSACARSDAPNDGKTPVPLSSGVGVGKLGLGAAASPLPLSPPAPPPVADLAACRLGSRLGCAVGGSRSATRGESARS